MRLVGDVAPSSLKSKELRTYLAHLLRKACHWEDLPSHRELLHAAAHCGHLEVCQLLADHGYPLRLKEWIFGVKLRASFYILGLQGFSKSLGLVKAL